MIRTLAVVAATAALAAAAASSAAGNSVGALELRAAPMSMNYLFGPFCAPGTAPYIECVRFLGTGGVPGLGATTVTYVKTLGDLACSDETPVRHFSRAIFDVAGKGTIELTGGGGLICGPPAPAVIGPFPFTVTGGSGSYAGATGQLSFNQSAAGPRRCSSGLCGVATDEWSGTIIVPGHTFDLTAPLLSGAVSRTVRAAKRATKARVRYAVNASDDVDGSVAPTCKPSSGTAFRVGSTRVTCTATDRSANTSRATFTVTVKRRK